jgi:ATP-dependent Clp protease ATP-binding subunit ClpC
MFRPEFLNRVDEVIVFHDLTSEEIEQIVDLMIGRLRDQLNAQGMGITLTEEARTHLAKVGFDPASGARPLRRAIQREVEDALSEQILAGQWKSGDMIEVRIEDGTIAFAKGDAPVVLPGKAATGGTTDAASAPARTPRRAGGRSGGRASGGAAGD